MKTSLLCDAIWFIDVLIHLGYRAESMSRRVIQCMDDLHYIWAPFLCLTDIITGRISRAHVTERNNQVIKNTEAGKESTRMILTSFYPHGQSPLQTQNRVICFLDIIDGPLIVSLQSRCQFVFQLHLKNQYRFTVKHLAGPKYLVNCNMYFQPGFGPQCKN